MTTPLAGATAADSAVTESGKTSDKHRSFESLNAMRDAHTHLLKAFYTEGATPAIIEAAKAFLSRGRLSGKNLDRGDERLEAQRILDQWGTVLMKSAHEEIDATLAAFEGVDLSDKGCPYVGLKPFGEADHGLFFGRERLCREGVAILDTQNFLAILGLSGSGKSSLVLGGILPDLRGGALPSSASWIYVPPMVPGADPLQSLVATFRANPGLLPKDFDGAQLVEKPDLLADAIAAADGKQSALLIVDQFEEAFTLCEDIKVREAFTKALLAFLDKSPPRHKIILTMRSDFEPRLASLPELQARFVENRTVLRSTALSRDELREAIEGPARAVGLHFHKEVVDALLKDVGDEMAALPLLQFTLRKLWDTKRRDRITLTDYNNICGAKGALAKSADEFYEGLLPEDQTIARSILLRMVRLGEGLEVTSARIRVSSLYELGYGSDRVNAVIQKLDQNGLIRITPATKLEDNQLEVAHEAMVRNWKRFVRWLEEDRASLLVRRRLDDKTLEWLRLGGGTSGLLDQIQLEEAQKWLKTASAKALGFHPSLPLLVQKSQEAIERAEQERQKARQALLDQTRKAEEQQRQRELTERDLENKVAFWKMQNVARRLRRITILALIENLAILIAVCILFWSSGRSWLTALGGVLILGSLILGGVILILAFPAMMGRRWRVFTPSRFKESATKFIANAHSRFRPSPDVKK